MINLRFHIVSIVAVFLALLIGILTGLTLLDRATVDVLKSRQRSLDETNDSLRESNRRLRDQVAAADAEDDAFVSSALSKLSSGTIPGTPVLFIAVRGTDEGVVHRLETEAHDAGADALGVIWLNDSLNLEDAASLTALGQKLSLSGDRAAVKKEFLAKFAEAIGSAPTSTSTSSVTTATAPPAATLIDPLATTTTTTVAGTTNGSFIKELITAGLAEWEAAPEDDQSSFALPANGAELVVLSGEGAVLTPAQVVVPLAKGLIANHPGLIVGEVRIPRARLEVVDDRTVPARGFVVDSLRSDAALAESTVTIDDLDAASGQVALLLALAQQPPLTSGAFGEAESAKRLLPDGAQ